MKKMMKKNLFLLTSFLLILSMLVGGMTMTGAQDQPLDLSAAEAVAQVDEARTGLALEEMPAGRSIFTQTPSFFTLSGVVRNFKLQ